MDKIWSKIIKDESEKPYFQDLMNILDREYKENTVFPKRGDIFNAFKLTPYNRVRCVIIGQDPYINPGEAQGLAFSVPDSVKTPPSLRNILKELEDDIGYSFPGNCLIPWAKSGVLLINRVLTVRRGESNSHKKLGWEKFTKEVIISLGKEDNRVFILWGRAAWDLEKYIVGDNLIIKSPHPSPLSAYRGFWGSKPFSKCNNFLKSRGIKEIEWRNNE